MDKAKITEIFSSIQGEGIYVGEKQLFVRFFGCNLGCKFCDERHKKGFSVYSLADVLQEISQKKEETISFTGGEPLCHIDFLKELLPVLKQKKFKIYLETNGTLPEALLDVMDFIDIISMDIKLPSSTGLGAFWDKHLEFLKIARRKDLFIKTVITKETTLADFEKAVSLVESVDRNIPLIIQPVSYNYNIERLDILPKLFDSASRRLGKVRIIPQIHKILGLR